MPCGDYVVDIRPGPRGLLDADIGLVGADDQSLWIDGFEVRVDGVQLDDPAVPVALTETVRETIENGVRIRHHFNTARGELDLVVPPPCKTIRSAFTGRSRTRRPISRGRRLESNRFRRDR